MTARYPRDVSSRIAILALVIAAAVAPAAAQTPHRFEAEGGGGWVGFADDGIVSEPVAVGAIRWYLTPRLGVGPEILYIDGSRHAHLVVAGNVTWNLLAPGRATPALTPFLVAGVGAFQTRESFADDAYSSTEGAFTAGGGVKAAVTDGVFVGVDARVGWELHLRVNALVGVRFGG